MSTKHEKGKKVTSLATREMYIKTASSPVRMAVIKKINNKCWQRDKGNRYSRLVGI